MPLMTCKQCGNQILEEADNCPDCGLRKEPSKVLAAPSPPPSVIKQSPVNESVHPSGVLVLLREMVTSGGLVRRIDFESVLLAHPDASVDKFTYHLQEGRFLTGPQRTTLLDQFKTRQIAEADNLLTAAIAHHYRPPSGRRANHFVTSRNVSRRQKSVPWNREDSRRWSTAARCGQQNGEGPSACGSRCCDSGFGWYYGSRRSGFFAGCLVGIRRTIEAGTQLHHERKWPWPVYFFEYGRRSGIWMRPSLRLLRRVA
jgi:hypothetical protein